ncbi:hypothetical protein PUNSTDRAFT_141653 [Punctularia strigosozonata HHB-11173 SS5]|uniref:uncharacterized protein n=1 Tax=Punctularia strigosozonata (strain HHB-11173) TaxID=741275 RepID=UPI0004418481|nr:uncharacterized protein PUNSTDRAFT_141653 [Punctularia strigosozonata HHB-11173 SS5]EIN11209.1 hypothetical protein PUNSTDRAFT_141653 [Punctularia strigosozonata HHB-11173 SS5]
MPLPSPARGDLGKAGFDHSKSKDIPVPNDGSLVEWRRYKTRPPTLPTIHNAFFTAIEGLKRLRYSSPSGSTVAPYPPKKLDFIIHLAHLAFGGITPVPFMVNPGPIAVVRAPQDLFHTIDISSNMFLSQPKLVTNDSAILDSGTALHRVPTSMRPSLAIYRTFLWMSRRLRSASPPKCVEEE